MLKSFDFLKLFVDLKFCHSSEILGEDSDDGDYDPRHGKPNSRRQQPTVEVLESGPGVAPGQQPPGAYLVPKNVSYGTMLAQGQLYFRSWQELQVS